MLSFSPGWKDACPGSRIGLLEMRCAAGALSTLPEAALAELEAELRSRHAGRHRSEIAGLPVMAAYVDHYRRFGKTYHVLLQLESVLSGQRHLAGASPLVAAMFAAEVETFILTAAHDLDRLQLPLTAALTAPGESYVGIGGRELSVKPGDMSLRDRLGIISSVLYGPDDRTRVTSSTTAVLYTSYLPAGVEDGVADRHLVRVEELVRLAAPDATTERREIRAP